MHTHVLSVRGVGVG